MSTYEVESEPRFQGVVYLLVVGFCLTIFVALELFTSWLLVYLAWRAYKGTIDDVDLTKHRSFDLAWSFIRDLLCCSCGKSYFPKQPKGRGFVTGLKVAWVFLHVPVGGLIVILYVLRFDDCLGFLKGQEAAGRAIGLGLTSTSASDFVANHVHSFLNGWVTMVACFFAGLVLKSIGRVSGEDSGLGPLATFCGSLLFYGSIVSASVAHLGVVIVERVVALMIIADVSIFSAEVCSALLWWISGGLKAAAATTEKRHDDIIHDQEGEWDSFA